MPVPFALSAFYFLNLRGDVLIERRYRDEVGREAAELFRSQILHGKGGTVSSKPVQSLGPVTYMTMRHEDVYMLCITKSNVNAMMAFQFMRSLVDLCKTYFGGKLSESSVRNNFVLMYELLDEVMDHGYPQITDPTVLKSLITQRGFSGDLPVLAVEMMQKAQRKKDEPAPNATLTVTGAVSWRRPGIKYKKNELFLDTIEQVNVQMSANGTVLRSDVLGKIMIKAHLSDMPELTLMLGGDLNEPFHLVVQDATFHQCVNMKKYEATQKSVQFVPPDGEFELMRYRCQDDVNLPFKVLSVVNEVARTRMEYNVTVKSQFNSKLFATSVLVLVPVPEQTSRATILVTAGKAKYDGVRKALVWKMPKFQGEAEHSLRAEVSVLSTTRAEKKPWVRPPITMQFSVLMFNASKLRIESLHIQEPKIGYAYKVDKWVRRVVRSGEYAIRM
ncbi:Mu homology domain-containing protein [Dunaliella salina]|uniref:Mu homology domain-containing protein n=1 Tax=Dunaliella salina TaxID=3046 RepID=A0ABQ7G6L7_DUNSA|nr:Mu homology domain-containing protein [Dunaliella salina]|eukprot:KAF5830251.1 Mu homology domain-containing protein [Dunaliella salina]